MKSFLTTFGTSLFSIKTALLVTSICLVACSGFESTELGSDGSLSEASTTLAAAKDPTLKCQAALPAGGGEQAWLNFRKARELKNWPMDQSIPEPTTNTVLSLSSDGSRILLSNSKYLALFNGVRDLPKGRGGLLGLADREYGVDFIRAPDTDTVTIHSWQLCIGDTHTTERCVPDHGKWISGGSLPVTCFIESESGKMLGPCQSGMKAPVMVLQWSNVAGGVTIQQKWRLTSMGLTHTSFVTGQPVSFPNYGVVELRSPVITGLGRDLTGQVKAIVPGKNLGLILSKDEGFSAKYSSSAFPMQFFGYYDKDHGLYLGAEDETYSPKNFRVDRVAQPAENGFSFVGYFALHSGTSASQFIPQGSVRLKPVCTDVSWAGVAREYRNWVKQGSQKLVKVAKREDLPAKLLRGLIWFTPNVGRTSTSTDFQNSTQTVIQQFSGLPVGFHLYHWYNPGFDLANGSIHDGGFKVKDGGWKTVISSLEKNKVFVVPYVNPHSADYTDYFMSQPKELCVEVIGKKFTANVSTSQLNVGKHKWTTGYGPVHVAIPRLGEGNTIPGGLQAERNYYVIADDSQTIRLALTSADALAKRAVTLTSAGSGIHFVGDYCKSSYGVYGELRGSEMRNPEGENGTYPFGLWPFIASAGGIGSVLADMCSLDKRWLSRSDLIWQSVRQLRTSGVYLDTFGSRDQGCWDENHHHPIGYGRHMMDGDIDLVKRWAPARKADGVFIAAERFADSHREMIDIGFNYVDRAPNAIPLYQAVYHDYQLTAGPRTAYYDSEPAFRYKTATMIVWGDQPGIFSASQFNSKTQSKIDFLRRLMTDRLNLTGFLSYGHIIAPIEYSRVSVSEKMQITGYCLSAKDCSNPIDFEKEAVQGAYWRSAGGDDAILFINVDTVARKVAFRLPKYMQNKTYKECDSSGSVCSKRSATVGSDGSHEIRLSANPGVLRMIKVR